MKLNKPLLLTLLLTGHNVAADPQKPVSPRNTNEIIIDAQYHPMGEELVAVLHLPQGATAENPVPGCAIIHGSGGLFKEDEPGQQCSDQVENTYAELSSQLLGQGIATILPSSFYSRDERFCEDNDNDYIGYAAAPFFNGDDTVSRSSSYKRRRVAIRAMDMMATMSYLCDLEQVDCSKTCMVGTSNGGTSILSYAAQSLPQDLLDYMNDQKRTFESNYSHGARTDAFENFPALAVSNETLHEQLTERPLPVFAQLISPGCSMRDMVPDIEPGEENHDFGLNELYYPAGETELTLEIATNDGVPDECYIDSGEGLREIQARYFEQESDIEPDESRYIIEQHIGGKHSLLRSEYEETIKARLDSLVEQHLLP
jgi:dienelactone hydrolase